MSYKASGVSNLTKERAVVELRSISQLVIAERKRLIVIWSGTGRYYMPLPPPHIHISECKWSFTNVSAWNDLSMCHGDPFRLHHLQVSKKVLGELCITLNGRSGCIRLRECRRQVGIQVISYSIDEIHRTT